VRIASRLTTRKTQVGLSPMLIMLDVDGRIMWIKADLKKLGK